VKRFGKYRRNCEKMGKIWMKCEMIWKIRKKSKLKSEKIWKIWKKGKLHSEMIWKIWKISVLVIITPKETSSSSSSLYTLFFRIEKNHPGIVFVRDYASRDQIYNFIFILFLEIPQ
jgi:hypothetical protein